VVSSLYIIKDMTEEKHIQEDIKKAIDCICSLAEENRTKP